MNSFDNALGAFDSTSRDLRQRTLTGLAFRRLLRHRLALVGVGVIALLIFAAVMSPWLAPYDPVEMDPGNALQAPTREHVMGTDEYGRDLFSRVVFGSRTSLAVGIISVSIALSLGTALGLVSGYYLGLLDTVISRAMDLLYAFPPLLLTLLIIAIMGTGIDKAMIALGIIYTPAFARVCRGSVLTERGKVYVEAAQMVGASNFRVIRTHILPNVLAPTIVNATLFMSHAILIEAALSYLGLGTQPPMPSWGMMLKQGRDVMQLSPWPSLWPGLAIMTVVLAFNVFGDGLRDALDPKLIGK